MFSTGTDFHKLIADAQHKQINTAADIADAMRDAIGWGGFKVQSMVVVGKKKLELKAVRQDECKASEVR